MDLASKNYAKLLEANKELEEINSQIVEFAKNEFPEVTTLITWGAVTYGSYIHGRSDFDFIIILKDSMRVEQIQEKLRFEVNKYTTSLSPDDLEITVLDYDALERGSLEGIRADRIYTLSKVDCYIISHFGKILFGELEALALFPREELKDFYPGVVQGVREKLKNELFNAYLDEYEPVDFIEKNIDNLMLMYRVLFTSLNGEIWGKVESIDWLIGRYQSTKTKNLAKLGNIVKRIYLRIGGFEIEDETFGELVHDAVKEFLRLTKN